ncbi:MAG: hypothetical protein M3345_01655 [Actinomycetota bacterium]|nr:hypothetical protein [Actinomycetota bacterium]
MRVRRLVPLLLIALLLPVPGGLAGGKSLPLRSGQGVFWNGPYVEEASDPGGDCAQPTCWVYVLQVADRGYRLRIGIDHPEVGDVFDVDVLAPGREPAGELSPGTGLYSAELSIDDPAPGRWTIEVRARDVTDTAFRMRAKLEARAPSLGVERGPVLPNLQVLPPHAASFRTPLTNGSTDGEPVGIEGGLGCHPEEHVEELAIRCLRFGFGIRNTGRGPMYLTAVGGNPLERELFQRVYRTDETWYDRSAGIARFHKTHGHFHHHDAVALRLYRVKNPEKGKIEAAGQEHRKGFAHRDELIRDWGNFYPDWDRYGFGLSAGWSDIYEWDRPGNYIDFGIHGDGRYVIRMWADPVDGIVESNELDNVGYTYLEVTGTEVELIESGRGRDPWDPCKIVVGFGGHPGPPPTGRPNDCPPDTT